MVEHLLSGSPKAVHVSTAATFELVFLVDFEADFLIHVDAVRRSACEQEREIKRITIVRGHDGRPCLAKVLEKATDRGGLC